MCVRSLILIALALPSAACTSSDVGCRVAPLSEISLFDKLALDGTWEHTATLVDAGGDPRLALGTTTRPVAMSWDVEEDFLYGITGSSHSIGFTLEGHYTAGFGEDGTVCLANDSRAWHERRWMRVDWTQALTTVDMLPLGEATEVESVFPPDDDSVAHALSLQRDPSGRLTEVVVTSWYVLPATCDTCALVPFSVEHTFRRLTP